MAKFVFKNVCLFFSLMAAVFGLIAFFPVGANAQEEETECDNLIRVIARNEAGNFISDISFEIYSQTADADGKIRPYERVAAGKTSAITGYSEIIFKASAESYALKMWDKNNSAGAFWFYDAFTANCMPIEVTKILSGIKFVLRNTDDDLEKNASFSVYTQRRDVDGDPIKEKQDLAATLNTSEEGEAIVYVPAGVRAIDGKGGDYYVFEAKGSGGGIFRLYDITVADGKTTDINYVFSDLKVLLKDSNNNIYANKQVEFYKQDYDTEGKFKLGASIKNVYTDDNGIAVIEYPAGLYALRIRGANSQYFNFWELEISDQDRNEYALKTEDDWNAGDQGCKADSELSLAVKDLSGAGIPGLAYEIYEQNSGLGETVSLGDRAARGTLDKYGQAAAVIHPDPAKLYALKIYDSKLKNADYWYYSELKFSCGQDSKVVKYLPGIKIILRDGSGELKKNQKFSIYTQKYDLNGDPINNGEDIVSSTLATSDDGGAKIFLPPYNLYSGSKGAYVFSAVSGNGMEFTVYNIRSLSDADAVFDYTFSDIALKIKNAAGAPLANKSIDFYRQTKDANGVRALGERLDSVKTDAAGAACLEYPAGEYAAVFKDDLNQNNIFYGITIKDNASSAKTLTVNLTRVSAINSDGNKMPPGASMSVYKLKKYSDGFLYKDKKVKTLKTTEAGFVEVMLAPDDYLFSIAEGKTEYIKQHYALNEKVQDIAVKADEANMMIVGKKYSSASPAEEEKPRAAGLAERLKGYILLQVQSRGEAWYVDAMSGKRKYLKNGFSAYGLMREAGLGIKNSDLEKIPVGLNEKFAEFDSDSDGLPDKLEETLGTKAFSPDSDSDGYNDGTEIKNGYSPLGAGKMPRDEALAGRLKGRILLQVEFKGQAWYVNPADGKRYYMKDGDSAYEVMRYLSLGISNDNLSEIEEE